MKKCICSIALILLIGGGTLFAQDPQNSVPAQGQAGTSNPGERPRRQGDGPPGGMRELFQNAISGSVQTITSDGLTIKKLDGTTTTVKTTKDTMFFKNRQQGKLSDFKVGEMVIVAGDTAGDTVTAKVVAERPNGPNAMNPEDLGKKFIVGEVTKIDETKLTVKRPDGVEQVIEVDEDTSFRNQKRESVTLADVKVGDRIMGRGELKNGTFVPATLMVGLPQGGMMFRRRESGTGGDEPKGPPPQSTNAPASTESSPK